MLSALLLAKGSLLGYVEDRLQKEHTEGRQLSRLTNYAIKGDYHGKIHPTQKPITLYKWILKNYATPDMKIFDSHLGSGSSAIAAWEFKCAEFVGTEIDLDYFEAAVLRFNNHTMQQKLF